MAIDIAIAGAAVALAGAAARNNANNEPTCTIQMHDGSSSKGLECIVRPIHEMSNGELALIIGCSIGAIILVIGSIALFGWLSDRRYERDENKNYQELMSQLYEARYSEKTKKKKKGKK